MKKLFVTLMAALFVLTVGIAAFAEDKAPAASEPAKQGAVKEEKAAAPAEPAKEAAPAATGQTQEQAQQPAAPEKK